MSNPRQPPFPRVQWHEVAWCLFLVAGHDCGCAALGARSGGEYPIIVLGMLMGPFTGWALVPEHRIVKALPAMFLVTGTVFIPLATYFWHRSASPTALLIAALFWMFWGFTFTAIGIMGL